MNHRSISNILQAGPAGCLLILWYPAAGPATSQALPDPSLDRSHCPALLLPQVPFGKMVFDPSHLTKLKTGLGDSQERVV